MNKTVQHYVPQAYLKAWEGPVCTIAQPEIIFKGVYYFEKDDQFGDGRTIKKILWEPHLYSITFEQLFIGDGCPEVYKDFVNQIYTLMKNKKTQPIYGKLGYSIIETMSSIRKHIKDIDKWDFYYQDGKLASKREMITDIHNMKSYILENRLDSLFETKWPDILSVFSSQVQMHKGLHKKGKDYYISIDPDVAYEIYAFFHMMECRNPKYNGAGVLSLLNDELETLLQNEDKSVLQGIWFTELYRMLYRQKNGYYKAKLQTALEKYQMVCLEATEGSFITSDNPVFLNETMAPEAQNKTGYIFPLSPKYLLYMCKGKGGPHSMMYMPVAFSFVKKMNRFIYSHREKAIVSTERELKKLI